MPKHGYKPVVEIPDGETQFRLTDPDESPSQAVVRAFFEEVGGPEAHGKALAQDMTRARGFDPETGKKIGDPKTQAVQVYHNLARGWATDAVKEKSAERDTLPYSSEEERAQLLEMLLEGVMDSRELRRKFVNALVKRDPELIEELHAQRKVIVDV